jgi:transcriptional regulator with XRE-family HTH domain
MKETVMFGRCLNELLAVKGWSAARLSREITLDSSYIRKWIKGERVPPIKSDYVEKIAYSLCSFNINEADNHKNDFLSALDNMEIDYNINGNLNDILLKVLTECQLYSLKFDASERMLISSSSEEDIVNLLFKIGNGNKKNTPIDYASGTNAKEYTIPSYIKGRQQILYAYTALLKAANKCSLPAKIITSFQSGNYFFDGFKDLEECYDNEIEALLNKDFTFYQLLRLDTNVARSIKIVKKIIYHLGIDKKFFPFYFKQYFTMYPACEILIIENIGALICFSTLGAAYLDSCFFYNDSIIVKDLFNYYFMMIEESKPLLRMQTSSNDYFIERTELDKKNGDLLCIRNNPDMITIPYELWEKYLTRTIPNSIEREEHMKRIRITFNYFNEHIKRYKFLNICTIQSIEYLLQNKAYQYGSLYCQPEPEDIARHIESIIYLLRTYENFELALINVNQIELSPSVPWRVKGDYAVTIDMWDTDINEDGIATGKFLTITESTIAESFRNYYFDIWNRITPKYRDKNYIISWLEDQLSWYKSENLLK